MECCLEHRESHVVLQAYQSEGFVEKEGSLPVEETAADEGSLVEAGGNAGSVASVEGLVVAAAVVSQPDPSISLALSQD